MTAKVSPLKGMPVDDYLARLPEHQAQIAAELRSLIQRAAPDATESIKWAQPVFDDYGPFAYIKPAKNHVTFGFWRGAEIADPRGLLEGGERMKHIKLCSLADIDKSDLTAFVKQAVALNRKNGDPTRR
jgi:hypothetical protein